MSEIDSRFPAEQECVDLIQKTFRTAGTRIVRSKRIEVTMRSDLMPPFLTYMKSHLGFDHLSHISCVDWLEDGHFELVFILWSYTRKIQLLAKCRIPRHEPEFISIQNIWVQANTYEREIHEMYGIHFEGNQNLGEFLLEDWEGPPPMRRDFDTVKYAMDTFPNRMDARQDAKNVRETISKRSDENLPGFAKPYSLR